MHPTSLTPSLLRVESNDADRLAKFVTRHGFKVIKNKRFVTLLEQLSKMDGLGLSLLGQQRAIWVSPSMFQAGEGEVGP